MLVNDYASVADFWGFICTWLWFFARVGVKKLAMSEILGLSWVLGLDMLEAGSLF